MVGGHGCVSNAYAVSNQGCGQNWLQLHGLLALSVARVLHRASAQATFLSKVPEEAALRQSILPSIHPNHQHRLLVVHSHCLHPPWHGIPSISARVFASCACYTDCILSFTFSFCRAAAEREDLPHQGGRRFVTLLPGGHRSGAGAAAV